MLAFFSVIFYDFFFFYLRSVGFINLDKFFFKIDISTNNVPLNYFTIFNVYSLFSCNPTIVINPLSTRAVAKDMCLIWHDSFIDIIIITVMDML